MYVGQTRHYKPCALMTTLSTTILLKGLRPLHQEKFLPKLSPITMYKTKINPYHSSKHIYHFFQSTNLSFNNNPDSADYAI